MARRLTLPAKAVADDAATAGRLLALPALARFTTPRGSCSEGAGDSVLGPATQLQSMRGSLLSFTSSTVPNKPASVPSKPSTASDAVLTPQPPPTSAPLGASLPRPATQPRSGRQYATTAVSADGSLTSAPSSNSLSRLRSAPAPQALRNPSLSGQALSQMVAALRSTPNSTAKLPAAPAPSAPPHAEAAEVAPAANSPPHVLVTPTTSSEPTPHTACSPNLLVDAPTAAAAQFLAEHTSTARTSPGSPVAVVASLLETPGSRGSGFDTDSSRAFQCTVPPMVEVHEPSPGSSLRMPSMVLTDSALRSGLLSTEMEAGRSVACVVTVRQAQCGEDEIGNETVNNYALFDCLGQGTSGAVWRCFQVDGPTNRQWAIKVIPRGRRQASGDVRREVAVMKKLRHPHVVALQEFIDDPAAEHIYLVMQLVPDGSVAAVDPDTGICRRLPPATVGRYASQLAAALDHVHRKDVVHGDIKPENILVDLAPPSVGCRCGCATGTAGGTAYLADFGVSRAVLGRWDQGCDAGCSLTPAMAASMAAIPRSTHGGLSLTAFGGSRSDAGGVSMSQLGPRLSDGPLCGLGTPMFMAPEVFAGRKPGKPADLWALGVTLYALLHGRLPYFGFTHAEIRAAVEGTEPRYADPDPAVAAWYPVLRRLLVKDPAARCTASELMVLVATLDGGVQSPLARSARHSPDLGQVRSAACSAPLQRFRDCLSVSDMDGSSFSTSQAY